MARRLLIPFSRTSPDTRVGGVGGGSVAWRGVAWGDASETSAGALKVRNQTGSAAVVTTGPSS